MALSNESIRILMVGNTSTGKSSIIRRYCDNEFNESEPYTIGVDFSFKTIYDFSKFINTSDENLPCFKYYKPYDNYPSKLIAQIWDVSGKPQFSNLVSTYYRHPKILMFVYSQNDYESFLDLKTWVAFVLDGRYPDTSNQKTIVIIVSNKIDLPRKVPESEELQYIQSLKKYWDIISFSRVCAKTGENIDKLFSDAIIDYFTHNPRTSTIVTIEDSKNPNSCCFC